MPSHPRRLRLAAGSPVSVAFSSNETTVTITNLKQTVPGAGPRTYTRVTRTFYRPIVTAWSYTASANTLWVAKTGNDTTGTGTFANPYLTITKALTVAGTSDIVYVMPGIYNEVVTVNPAGTLANPFILSCAPKAVGGGLGTVTVTRPAADVVANPWRSTITLAGDYARINGLIVRGARGMAGAPIAGEDSANACGIFLQNAPGLTSYVSNCVCHSSTHCGIKGVGEATIESCVLLDNGLSTVDHGIYLIKPNNVIHGNIILDNIGAGVHLYSGSVPPDSPDDCTVTRNLGAGNTDQILIAGHDNTVQYNTCSGGYSGVRYYSGSAMIIDHNVISGTSTYTVVRDSGTTFTDANNCLDGTESNYTPGAGVVQGDPLFTDPTGGDFRLQGGSPCPTFGCYA